MDFADLGALAIVLFFLWIIWKVTKFIIKLILIGFLVALIMAYFHLGL
ncbi:hypothetical protein JF634_04635 [Simonsiella muelleri]|jgi:hypothetical protein|uniref:Uncharacterized protein n=1 Tax=Simonsiella muelleri ATCC 29453 TaxID=641147 RepID=U6Q1E9_9NEIS|nr:hypothetical protein [Simonsiella muelleri]EJZ50152.1 hypothetical protein HMPREF9021_02609 [Simonsiella muelleri ATCC 29453]UBQ54769.1 hypothetical protein JF634_04635 [Simonsiella muelleri]